jgi:hypothetical protein
VKRARLAALAATFLAALAVASYWIIDRYGELAYVPGFVSGLAATVIAFVLALEFEARRENRALVLAEEETNRARVTEARKRLLALRTELEKNQTSIGQIVTGLRSQAEMGGGIWRILHPQLLDGAWAASGGRLGDLLADYELVSDVSIFYGRLEELRWRLRYRTQARIDDLDRMTLGLASEMKDDVVGLLKRISEEERQPGVRGVTHIGRTSGPVQLTPAGREFFERMVQRQDDTNADA